MIREEGCGYQLRTIVRANRRQFKVTFSGIRKKEREEWGKKPRAGGDVPGAG
jgi:hypothetical protein